MPIPLSTEKVARAVIKALVRGNFLSDSAQAEKLYAVPANATDDEINVIVNSLTYSTPGVGGENFVSDGDINMWVDADNLPAIAHTDYFRIARNGSSAANLSPSTSAVVRELMTVGRLASMLSQANTVEVVIGPRKVLLGVNPSNYGATLEIGAWYNGTAYAYGTLLGTSTAVQNTSPGFSITGKPALELYANDLLGIRGTQTGVMRGGFLTPNATTHFFVGETPTGALSENALSIRQSTVNAKDFIIQMQRDLTWDSTLFVNSTEQNWYSIRMALGGYPGIGDRDPRMTASAYAATLMVLGTALGNEPAISAVAMQSNAYAGKVVRILGRDPVIADQYSLLTCEQYDAGGGAYVNRFKVRNDGNVYADGAYASPAADLAEWMDSPEQFDPGTVLVMRAGQLRPTQQIAETGVMGVVSTKPGVILNAQKGATQTRVLVARSGIVPVKCSTLCGVIHGDGEVLVAGPDGCAVLSATQHPAYGTIVGKAQGVLGGGTSPPTVGMIDVLVGA